MQDIENLRTKCESAKCYYSESMIDYLKKQILLQNDYDTLSTDFNSPKV